MSDELERAREVQPGEARLNLVWLSMSGAVVLYALLALVLVPEAPITIDREIEGWILVFLAMTAGLHVLVSLLLRQLLASLSKGNYVTYCLLRWGLQEGIAVYGLILHFIGVGIGVTSIFFAVALLLLGASRHGRTDRAVFVSQFR